MTSLLLFLLSLDKKKAEFEKPFLKLTSYYIVTQVHDDGYNQEAKY